MPMASTPSGREQRESRPSFQSVRNMAANTTTGTARLDSPSGRAWASNSSMLSMSSMNIFFQTPTPFSWIAPRGCFSSLLWRWSRRFSKV